MRRNFIAKGMLLGLIVTWASAKDKGPIMPGYVLRAQTVAVMIDPDAVVSLKDPNANQTAQKDVEVALTNWGRFRVVLGGEQADLVIVLRKGLGKLTEETIPDNRPYNRPGSVTPSQDGITIGAQHGSQPSLQGGNLPDAAQNGTRDPKFQMEIGNVDDSFVVYEGKREEAVMDSPPAWRWVRQNGLHSHDVPAVDEFRKAIAEAEKKASQQKKKP